MKRKERGTAIVEFALVFPLVLFLLFVIIEFGILIYNQQVITNASREGARAGVMLRYSGTPPSPKRLNANEIITITKNLTGRLITFASGTDTPTTTVCLGGCVDSNTNLCNKTCDNTNYNCKGYNDPLDGLQVNVNYTYTFGALPGLYRMLFGNNGTTNLVLRARTTMRCE